METFHKLVISAKAFLKKHWLICAFIALAFVLLVGIRLNAESVSFGAYYADEYHTIHEGLDLIVHGTVENFRAQESVRWLVRVFYPYALVQMNTHMGGNVHIVGWEYPGHEYVITHFVDAPQTSNFSLDPNLRLLFHSLRVEYIVFVFACVLALLLSVWKMGYRWTAFGLLLLLGLSTDLINEQKLFYLEPAIIASLALFLLAYGAALYRRIHSNQVFAIFGFLAAWMVSTKFSTIFFVLLPFILLWEEKNWRIRARKAAWYVGSAIGSYLLINFPAFINLSNFNRYLHDLSSNFWQYAAGSDAGVTVAPGMVHLGLLIYQLEGFFGYALYSLPLIMLFGFWYATRRERLFMAPILLFFVLSIWGLSKQYVYMPRNLVPFYLPISLVTMLCFEISARVLLVKGHTRRLIAGITLVCVLWIAGIFVHAGGVGSFISHLTPNIKNIFISSLEAQVVPGHTGQWLSIDFSDSFFSNTSIASSLTRVTGAPIVLSNKNYPAFEARFSSLSSSTVVLVDNIVNNKHLVTYILPKYFNQNIQVGNYFAFFNMQ